MSGKSRLSKYHKRVSVPEDDAEPCWKEENGGVDARYLKSVKSARDAPHYYRYNM